MRTLVTAAVLLAALAAGVWLTFVDARTDDTGIEAGLIFLVAFVLAALRPRAAIIIAFLVGSPIPISEAMQSGAFPAGIAALGFAFAGALLGAYLGIIVRRSLQPTT